MSLVGSLYSLLVLAATGVWTLALLDILPINQRQIWGHATRSLRARNRLLPAVAFVGGWFFAWFLSAYMGASLALALTTFVWPLLLVWEFWLDGLSLAIGLPLAAVSSFIVGPEDDPEKYALPMEIRETQADDVSPWLSDSVPIPRRSLLVLGASGAGKSETLKHFIAQTDLSGQTVVYDHKSDYEDALAEWGIPYTRVSLSGSDVAWNVFEELDSEDDADEVARALFPDEGGDPFFTNSARQLFAANLKYLRRELDEPDNTDLIDYWRRADADKMHENLTSEGHEDLTGAASAIDPDASRQRAGVFAQAQQRISDLFVGDFAAEGDFSMRDYFERPEEYGVLLLSADSTRLETTAPVFAHLLDSAIAQGLSSNRETTFFLDEVEHLGVRLRRLGELINVGRGSSSSCLLSLQSVSQLQATYGKERAESLLSGMATTVAMRVGDRESSSFVEAISGTHVEERTTHVDRTESPLGGMVETGRETTLSVESDFKGDITKFEPGEALVLRQGKGLVHGRVRLLSELPE